MPFRQTNKDRQARSARQSCGHGFGHLVSELNAFATAAIFMMLLLVLPCHATEELVGLRVGNLELETLLAHKRKGRFWLPLEETGGFLSLKVVSEKDGMRLATPIGVVDVPSSAVFRSNSSKYIDQKFLETRLNARVKFAEGDGYIDVDLPWRPGAAIKLSEGIGDERQLSPEALPPPAGISTLHGDVSYRFGNAGNERVFEGYFRATGHAHGGVWQINYQEDLLTNHRIRDAIWMKQLDDNRFIQIGHQTLAVHPLLQSIEMTGVQYAWTNAKAARTIAGINTGALLGRRVDHQRSFAGEGPVGGRAELWLDDSIYAQTPIGLSGEFRFSDVHLPARQSRIEIRIYDRGNGGTPIKVIRKSLNLSELLLENGQHSVLVGAGYGGNAFDQAGRGLHGEHSESYETDGVGRLAAFALGRYAVSDNLTLESGVTITDDTPRAMVGGVARFSTNVVGSGSVSLDDKTGATYLAEFDWRKTDWRLIARSYHRQHSINDSFTLNGIKRYDPDWDHFLELTYAVRSNLSMGLIARAQPEAEFVLPFALWRPIEHMSVEVRPDQFGVYRIDGRYRLSSTENLYAAYYDDDSSVSYTRLFDDRQLTVELQHNRHDVWRAGLRLSGGSLIDYDLSWNVGGYVTDDADYWVYAGVRREVRHGVHVYANANYASTQQRYFKNDDTTDWRLRVGLSFDLAPNQDGFVAAPGHGVDVGYGAIAGRVKTDGDDGKAELANMTVKINGKPAGRTAKDGSFYLPRVEIGVHIVEFDQESLPIQQVATKASVVAKVVPGAVTNVAFVTKAEYGVAGQVLNRAGEPISNATVVVLDAQSIEVGRGQSSSFGYYRIDGLRKGDYRVTLLGDNRIRSGARMFTINSEFLFGVHLKLR